MLCDLDVRAGKVSAIRGAGLRLTMSDGTTLLDAVSGTFNLPLGYDHPRVRAAMHSQLDRGVHVSSQFSQIEAEALKADLLAVAPRKMGAVWLRDVTGSTAVECAVRIAQKRTGKTDVVSLFTSHHGQTIFTTGLSGNAFRRRHSPAASGAAAGSVKVPAPYCHRCFFAARHPGCGLLCATRIQDFIDYASSGQVAALILEPVQGNGGNIVPPPGYFAEIRRLCDRNGILLIADEVQTGIGRTGQMFACQSLEIDADLIVFGKGIGGIGMPLAGVLMRKDCDVLESYEHSFTSGANLLALAAARATLEVVGSEGVLASVRARGERLGRGLRRLARNSAMISDVRGVGLMWGIEISGPDGGPSNRLTNQIIEAALAHGLVLRGSRYGFGNVVKVRPALIATDDDIDEILERLELALALVAERAVDA